MLVITSKRIVIKSKHFKTREELVAWIRSNGNAKRVVGDVKKLGDVYVVNHYVK